MRSPVPSEVPNARLIARLQVTHADFALHLALDLPARGVTALFGRSGSGKTTALRAIAGLLRPANAFIAIGDAVWQDIMTRAFSCRCRAARTGLRLPGSKPVRPSRCARQYDIWHEACAAGRAPRRLGAGCRIARRRAIAQAAARSTLRRRAPARRHCTRAADKSAPVADGRTTGCTGRNVSKQAILPYLERLHDELAIPVSYVSHAAIDEVAPPCRSDRIAGQGCGDGKRTAARCRSPVSTCKHGLQRRNGDGARRRGQRGTG